MVLLLLLFYVGGIHSVFSNTKNAAKKLFWVCEVKLKGVFIFGNIHHANLLSMELDATSKTHIQ